MNEDLALWYKEFSGLYDDRFHHILFLRNNRHISYEECESRVLSNHREFDRSLREIFRTKSWEDQIIFCRIMYDYALVEDLLDEIQLAAVKITI